MATRGRKPKPPALHRLQGTFQPVRHAAREANMPKAEGDLIHLPPPDHLDDAHQRVWKEVVSRAPAGVLAYADIYLLDAFVKQIVIVRRAGAAQDMLDQGKQLPYLAKNNKGGPQLSPYIGAVRRATAEMTRLAAELGFSPASRVRLLAGVPGAPTPPVPQTDDPWESFTVIPGGKR
jgi:P27 family predicted phage terminase small subunit